MPFYKACWITSDNKTKLNDLCEFKHRNIVKDKDNNYVFLADSEWALNMIIENNPEIAFHFTSEHK